MLMVSKSIGIGQLHDEQVFYGE